MNKLMELVDLHADAVCNVLEGAEDATSGKSWVTIRDELYAEIQAIADSLEWRQEQQIKRDAEICDENTTKFPPCTCAELIRNQDKGDL